MIKISNTKGCPLQKEIEKPDYSLYDVAYERKKLRDAADQLGIIVLPSFLEKISDGDIIEIYQQSPINKQVYGNEEFSRICSYSREQMKTIPFPKLFWREPEYNELLFKRAAEVVKTQVEAVRWDLPDHELVESLHPRKRTFNIKMGWIAPCFLKEKPNQVWGWASTLKVDLIFQWPEDIN